MPWANSGVATSSSGLWAWWCHGLTIKIFGLSVWLVGSQLLASEVFPWQQKVVFFSGVVDGFLVVENTMTSFFFFFWVSRSGGGWSLWGVVAVYAWTNLEWVWKDWMLWYQVDDVASGSASPRAKLCRRIGAFTDRLVLVTISLTWVCFSMWVLVCFKFLGLFFCGFDDFSGFMGLICWRFRWRMVFGWKMGTSPVVVGACIKKRIHFPWVDIWVCLKLAWVGIWVCLRLVWLSLFRFEFMGLFLRFIYGLVWFLGFISCFSGFDGVDLVAGFGFGVCWKLVYFMDLGRTRRTSSVLTKK